MVKNGRRSAKVPARRSAPHPDAGADRRSGALDKSTDQLGLVLVRIEQHLDGQVAAEVDIAAPQHGPHAAAGDLAEELIPVGTLGRPGISVDDGMRIGPGPVSISESRRGHGAPRRSIGDTCQDARRGGLTRDGEFDPARGGMERLRPASASSRPGLLHQAAGAEALGTVGGPRHAALRAARYSCSSAHLRLREPVWDVIRTPARNRLVQPVPVFLYPSLLHNHTVAQSFF